MSLDKDKFWDKVKASKKPAKVRTSFALDKSVYDRFIKECAKRKVSASKAIEQFMKDQIGE